MYNPFQKTKEDRALLKQMKAQWKNNMHTTHSELSRMGLSAEQIWRRNLVINS